MRKTLPYAIPLFIVLIVALITAGCTGPAPQDPPKSCGISTCHGLDLACTDNPPEVCTMEYRLGDKCRQYARCDTTGGTCTLVTDPAFAPCKACAEECAKYSSPADAFACEAKC